MYIFHSIETSEFGVLSFCQRCLFFAFLLFANHQIGGTRNSNEKTIKLCTIWICRFYHFRWLLYRILNLLIAYWVFFCANGGGAHKSNKLHSHMSLSWAWQRVQLPPLALVQLIMGVLFKFRVSNIFQSVTVSLRKPRSQCNSEMANAIASI